jgi:isopenicillin-N epimerase
VQSSIHPLVISHGYGGGFLTEFDWTGTRDPGSWLAIETALDFVETIGADLLRARNNALRREAAALLCQRWAVEPPAPDALLGAMATLPLPQHSPFAALPSTIESAKRIRAALWDRHRIEVPAIPFADRIWVRISAQIYNEIGDYRRLADALG